MGNTLGAPRVFSRVRLKYRLGIFRDSRRTYDLDQIKLSVGNHVMQHNPLFWCVDRGSIWTSFSPQILL